MSKKLAQVAVAAVVAAGVALFASPGSAQFRHGGGGGGAHFGGHGFGGHGFGGHGFGGRGFGGGGFGGGGMRFASHGFGGARPFGRSGFAGAPLFRSGGFAHFGAGRYALGGGGAWRYANAANAGRFGATQAFHHGWSGWQGYRRGYVGWGGPVFWPYAYNDVFDYAFWPYGGPYDDLFWSYGYDDLFAGILLPYALLGLEGGYGYAGYAPGPVVSGSAPQANAQSQGSGGAPVSASQLCGSAQSLAGGAAIDAIAKAVNPTGDQTAKLDALKASEADAGKALSASCAAQTPMTAVARLDAVQTRLQAMIQAANTVGGPLNDFYASLNDEQKAAFNALGDNNKNGAAPNLAQMCGPDNAVPAIAVDRISSAVKPDEKQQQSLAALRDAASKADDAVVASCPKEAPLTPTGRLDAVKARLQAMANAVDTVKPPLQDFYASLSDEQKARFDSLTQPPNAAEQQHAEAKP
jgi:hypothetical protein